MRWMCVCESVCVYLQHERQSGRDSEEVSDGFHCGRR